MREQEIWTGQRCVCVFDLGRGQLSTNKRRIRDRREKKTLQTFHLYYLEGAAGSLS